MHRSLLLLLLSLAALTGCPNGTEDDGRDTSVRKDADPSDAAQTEEDAADPDAAEGDATDPDSSELDSEVADTGEPPDMGVPFVVQVTVTPTAAVLISVDGSQPTQSFEAVATYVDGSTVSIPASMFTVDPLLLGAIDPNTGVFTANGRFGGEGRVIATLEGITGEASIRIEIEQTVLVAGTSTTVIPLFEQPGITDTAREAMIVYPLQGAVMPQNVPPAEVQWLRSAVNDAFRITLRKPNVEVFAYYAQNATPTFTNSWSVDLSAWRRIAQSEPDELAEITVDRWIAATNELILGTPIQVSFAQAALLGSIYYWDIVRGRIVRINDGTTTRDEFMPSPQLGCIGCHSVSPSGRYMAGRFGGGENIGGTFDLTQNLTTSPPPTLFTVTSTTIHWWFSAWSPTEDRLVVSTWEQGGPRGLEIINPFNGRFVAPTLGTLPTGNVTHPAWSPDGTAIAYIGNTNNWGGANTTGDVFTLPVLGQDQFGAPMRVMTGTTPPGLPIGSAANYPSWSPDSEWIAFAHGNSSRSESGQSALYLMRRDGRDLVRLDNASGGPNGNVSFQPRFSPFAQDGYFWLSFLSRRDYGNNLAGTQGTGRQQIWVAAVRVNPAPEEDPSEVPYWLPGQSRQSLNISAYWAPRACRNEGDTCGVDAECCSGACDASAQAPICVPPASGCLALGEACTDNAQCCNAVLCVDGTCGGL